MAEKQVLIDGKAVDVSDTKSVLSLNSLSRPTPAWVNWVFRVQFVANKAILMWLGSTSLVNVDNLREIILALGVIDFAVWGIGRFIGLKKDDFQG